MGGGGGSSGSNIVNNNTSPRTRREAESSWARVHWKLKVTELEGGRREPLLPSLTLGRRDSGV